MGFIFIIYFLVGVLIYFAPSFVAFARNHQNAMAIFTLNFFLGWTFFGWVAAFVWAMTAVKTEAEKK